MVKLHNKEFNDKMNKQTNKRWVEHVAHVHETNSYRILDGKIPENDISSSHGSKYEDDNLLCILTEVD
jgi:hypothetical protein